MQQFLNSITNGGIPKLVSKLPQLKNAVGDFIGEMKIPERPSYAYPYNSYIDIALSNNFSKKALGNLAKIYCPKKETVIEQASILNSQSFPRTWANYQHCCNTLEIDNAPKTYVTPKLRGLNALCITADDETLILLSRQVISEDDAEQRFILGHELGHVQMGHIAAHSLQGLLGDINRANELVGAIANGTLAIPLNEWYRVSELSADRAGYLCSRNIEAITALLESLDPYAANDGFAQYVELYRDHPNAATRIAELKKFIEEKNV